MASLGICRSCVLFQFKISRLEFSFVILVGGITVNNFVLGTTVQS